MTISARSWIIFCQNNQVLICYLNFQVIFWETTIRWEHSETRDGGVYQEVKAWISRKRVMIFWILLPLRCYDFFLFMLFHLLFILFFWYFWNQTSQKNLKSCKSMAYSTQRTFSSMNWNLNYSFIITEA